MSGGSDASLSVSKPVVDWNLGLMFDAFVRVDARYCYLTGGQVGLVCNMVGIYPCHICKGPSRIVNVAKNRKRNDFTS